MAGSILELHGCTPEPLGNYLKALGLFRLIAEQVDPQARAWWEHGHLHIFQRRWERSNSIDLESQLADWLLRKCRFSPLIAPWQKGTGYLPIGRREAGREALSKLLTSQRRGTGYFRCAFRDFATAMGVIIGRDRSKWLDEMTRANADLPPAQLHRRLRNRVHVPSSLKWLDAVGIAASRADLSDVPMWFPILARGGGEASGQYIVNYQQRLEAALLRDASLSRSRLLSSLRGDNQVNTLEANASGAMYYPSLMEAPNVGQSYVSDPKRRVNPWDFILLLEGSLVWSIAATRRHGVTSDRASFPFYCRSSFGGSTTIGPKEVEGAEQSIAAGELWCPTWTRPSSLPEVQRIFSEGRLQVCEKACSRSLEFALAMRGFGLDRGIEAFHRCSLLRRSGSGRQTFLLAVPGGSFVPERSSHLSALAEVRPFAESISANVVESGQQQRRFILARIEFERAWFAATTCPSAGDGRRHVPDLLISVARLMRELGTNAAKPGVVKIKRRQSTAEKRIPPVGKLSRRWTKLLEGADDSCAFRLARAVGGITAWGQARVGGTEIPAVESLVCNLMPVKRQGRSWIWSEAESTAVWARGATLYANLARVLRRRLIDAQRGVGSGLPVWSSYGARFEDLLSFWQGTLDKPDEQRLSDLILSWSLIDQGDWDEESIRVHQIREDPTPDLRASAIAFDPDERASARLKPIEWKGRQLVKEAELRAAFELPRVYHLLKLCFTGGQLPRRPVEGITAVRSGFEPSPPACLDILTLVESGRICEAAQVAARRLRAKGYPTLLNVSGPDSGVPDDSEALGMDPTQSRRLAAMLLIPVRHPGVSASLAIKPETIS